MVMQPPKIGRVRLKGKNLPVQSHKRCGEQRAITNMRAELLLLQKRQNPGARGVPVFLPKDCAAGKSRKVQTSLVNMPGAVNRGNAGNRQQRFARQ